MPTTAQSDTAKPIPVRLSAELIRRLDAAAALLHTNRAAVIRLCADTFATHVLEHGTATMPPDWIKLLPPIDGRANVRKQALASAQLNEPAGPSQPALEAPPVNYKQALKSKRTRP
jgi:hypothetical protein